MIYSGFTYYKMANLDNRISNADQLLTQDVERLCDTIGELYSNICKVRALCPYIVPYVTIVPSVQ